MNFKINDDIELVLFNQEMVSDFYRSIHEMKNYSDTYRNKLQNKYDSEEKLKARVEDAIFKKYRQDGTPDFFILKKGKIIGVFEFHPLSDEDFLEVGFWLFSEHRRKGIVSSLFPTMIDYARDNFEQSKMMATTPLGNVPSQKLLETVGFEKTGQIIEVEGEKGKMEKELVYLLLL